MSSLIDKSVRDTNKVIDGNEELSQRIKKKKRYIGYAIRGVNKTHCKQIKRDFTMGHENKLIKIANEVNADEGGFDIGDLLKRWFLDTNIGWLVSNIWNLQKICLDSYNYFGKTIREIFRQARECDDKYNAKISKSPIDIAQSSVNMLTQLNEAFSYNSKNKCGLINALDSQYFSNEEVINSMYKLSECNKATTISDFVKKEENIDIFNEYSNIIYKRIGIDSDVYNDITLLIKDKEGMLKNIADEVTKKLIESMDKGLSESVETLISDKDVAKALLGIIKASGLSDKIYGTLKLYILKLVKDNIYRDYKELFSKELPLGQEPDYKKIKELYHLLKELEKDIITGYSEMNTNNPDRQVEANEWLAKVEDENCGELQNETGLNMGGFR